MCVNKSEKLEEEHTTIEWMVESYPLIEWMNEWMKGMKFALEDGGTEVK